MRVSGPQELSLVRQALPPQYSKPSKDLAHSISVNQSQGTNFSRPVNTGGCLLYFDVTIFNSHRRQLTMLETLKTEGKSAACIFCNARITFGQSACPECMKKYNIRPFDLGSDGCGCDK
jgi:hypothetical protein